LHRLEVRHEIARTVTGVELLGKNAFPRRATSTGGAWQAAHQRAVGQPGQGPALHRGRADVEDGNRRNNSPKPSICLSSKQATASGVLSRPVNPVPPVISTT